MEIKGICPIAPAVYNDRGEVDLDDYSSCCEKLIGLGAQALTLFGIAGEYYKMDTEEEQQLIKKKYLRELKKRLKVLKKINRTLKED